ncbi:MAG: conjugal transfer protein TraF [Rickettsiaceae bacterium]|nr:conjugal transfer protein TraF [Rickettsiaceae bacterium]
MKKIIMMVIINMCSCEAIASKQFFEERYRGWMWFEENEQQQEELLKQKRKKSKRLPTPQEAERIIKQKKKDLDDARNVMLAAAYDNDIDKRSYLEAVKKYRILENQMHLMALKMAKGWGETNLLNPEFTDEYNFPVNVYGRKLKEELEAKENTKILEKLAKFSEIFIFRTEDCHYCHKMEKHLNLFAKRYGFKVHAVSVDGSKSNYFATTNSKELAKELGVEVAPTIFLVNDKNEYHRYQIAIGAVSIQELEENCLQAAKLLKEGISNGRNS